MSLFHAKEWWSHKPECPSECSPSSLLIAPIDGDPSSPKLITGSFTGHLRIFSPSNPPRIEDLLLETSLDDPILHIEAGRFIPSTSRIALAVLCPKKLSVYTVNPVKSAQSGTSYLELSHAYTHRFHHHAYSLTTGPFGQPQAQSGNLRDHLAVLTLDGQLLFFEQDTFAFSRFIPGFLYPSAFIYIRPFDSFLLATATYEVDCYRYSVLGESHQSPSTPHPTEESKDSLDAAFRHVQHAKKLHADWSANVGEAVLDVQLARAPGGVWDVVVLGKRTLWALKENGSVRLVKRLDFAPLGMCVFRNESKDGDQIAITSEECALHLYHQHKLIWACRLPFVACSVQIAQNIGPCPGMITVQSDTNQLCVAYLGTQPPVNAVSTAMARELDYDAMDVEHRKLLKTMKQAAGDKLQEPKDKLILKLSTVPITDPSSHSEAVDVFYARNDKGEPLAVDIVVTVSHTALSPLTNVNVTLSLPLPFHAPTRTVNFSSLAPNRTETVSFRVYVMTGVCHCYTLAYDVMAHFSTPDLFTRVTTVSGRLPLSMYGRIRAPVKNVSYFYTVDCNQSPPTLPILFPDLFPLHSSADPDQSASVFSFYTWTHNDDVTVLVSKKTGRYRVQSAVCYAMGVMVHDLVARIQNYHQGGGANGASEKSTGGQLTIRETDTGEGTDLMLKYDEDLPLEHLFSLLDAHHSQRCKVREKFQKLDKLGQQFRAIQKRLLIRYTDKNPPRLLSFDLLLTETYRRISSLCDDLSTEEKTLKIVASQLLSVCHAVVSLMALKYGLDRKNADALRQAFNLGGGEGGMAGIVLDADNGSGWEERVDLGVSHVLRYVLTKTPKSEEQVGPITSEPLKDTGRLKKHIILLNERLARGVRFVSAAKDGAGKAAVQSPGTPPASASGARRGEDRRRQPSVDMRQAQPLVEVYEEDTN